MGQRFSITGQRPAAHPPAPARRTRFHARSEEVTPELLCRISRERESGRLAGVTLDCRKTQIDDDTLDRLEKAAGINRLVLEC